MSHVPSLVTPPTLIKITILELVMCGAMDECDVVLTFVGQHIGSSCEVLGRLVWHFDVVGDCGILATGLH